jgi:hypothetical protein
MFLSDSRWKVINNPAISMTEINLITINSVGIKVILGLACGYMISLTQEHENKMNMVRAF